MKCVMVIDKELPLGLIANTAAVLAVSLGSKIQDIVGEDVLDGDGSVHPGITQATISLLGGDNALIHTLRQKMIAQAHAELYYVDFCDVAQRSKRYEEYRDSLSNCSQAALNYLGLALYGPNKLVDRLTGNIPLLR